MIVRGTGIDMSRARYPTSRQGCEEAGLVVEPHDSLPSLIWIDGILTTQEAETLQEYQRVNKIPSMHFLCFKSTLFSELNRMRSLFPDYFEFYPHTYLLPDDFPALMREHTFVCGRTATAPTWVIKPRSGCCGKGIHFVQSVQEIEAVDYPSVAQLLVNPMLLNGKKFDFRFFLLVSSLEPFSAFIYKEGIARFCTQDYIVPTKQNLDRPYALLTNTAINKTSDANPDDYTKLASEVLREVIAKKASASKVWDEICEVSLMTLVGLFPAMLAMLPLKGGAQARAKLVEADGPRITIPKPSVAMYRKNVKMYPFIGAPHRKKAMKKKRKAKKKVAPLEEAPVQEVVEVPESTEAVEEPTPVTNPKEIVLTEAQHYWHILGIDIILDSKGHPRVLELNDRPSLQVTAPFEKELKEGLIREAFLHLSLDGSTFGNNEHSKWQQILPVPDSSPLSGPIKTMMQNKSNLKYSGRTGANSESVQRMMAAGIKQEYHDTYRARYFGPPKLDPTIFSEHQIHLNLPGLKDDRDDHM